MAKFKYVQRVNPNKRKDPAKWYASPTTYEQLDTKAVCRAATRNTSTSATELSSSVDILCDAVPGWLQQGFSVRIGTLGSMRLSFGSTGVESIDKFDASTMIKNVKIIFTPSKELKTAVMNGLTFENAGVVVDGFSYPSVKAYNEFQVSARNPQNPGDSGGGSGDFDPDPFG